MIPGRLLLLISDRTISTEIERALQKFTTIVVPNNLLSIEDCFHAGDYHAIVVSFDYASKYASELLNFAENSELPSERILIYQQSEWNKLAPLIERGVVSRLVPHFWDVQTMVDLLIRLCERHDCLDPTAKSDSSQEHTTEESELRKRIVELEMQNRRLLALATTDGLTGLANRRELNDVLTKEISRSRRFNQSLSFVMCDVDYFKHYNDNFGHPAGDDILQTIAALMRSRLRASDLAARYGGEEFGLILPMTSQEAAYRVANSLRQRIEEHKFPHGENQPNGRLTISMGVAAIGTTIDNAAQLIDAADRALYRAKHTGRNKVVAFDPDNPEFDFALPK